MTLLTEIIGFKIRSSEGSIYTVTEGNITDAVKALEGKSNRTIENELFALDAKYTVDKTVYQDPHMPQFKPQGVQAPAPKNPVQAAMEAAEFQGQKFADKVIVSDRQVGGTHYKDMDIEPWAAIKSWLSRDEWIGFLRGNIIKYQARARSGKGTLEENLRKANHYAETLDKTLAETQPLKEESNEATLTNLKTELQNYFNK